MSQERADATLEQVRGWGINHIDTAAGYGASEDRLKPWLAAHRSQRLPRHQDRRADGPRCPRRTRTSLERMGVDHVDLIQLHNLVEPDEWEVAFGPGGAFEALAQARDEGLVANIGVTGHGIRIAGMHLRSIERLDVASVLLPFNFVLHGTTRLSGRRRAAARGVRRPPDRGADDQGDRQGSLAPTAPIATSAGTSRSPTRAAIGRAVRYVLSNPQLFLNTTSDARSAPAHRRRRLRPSRCPDAATSWPADVADHGITAAVRQRRLERI